MSPLRKIYSLTLYKVTEKYFVSFPKSGRTWVRFFLANYISIQNGTPLKTNYFTLRKDGFVDRFHFTHGNFFDRDVTDMQSFLNKLEGKKVCFIVRDPRDVLVSFYYHNRYRMSFLDGDKLDLQSFVRHPRLGIQRIVEYYNFIFDNNKSFSSFVVIKYENLQRDPKSEFKKIIDFLEIPFDEDTLNKAIELSRFRQMKKLEKDGAVKEHLLTPGNLQNENSFKVRSGKIGSFKDELSLKDVKYCKEVMENLKVDLGYEI